VRQQEEEKAAEEGPPDEGDCKINRMAANKLIGCFFDANKTLRNGSQGTTRVYKAEINRGISFFTFQQVQGLNLPEHGLSSNSLAEDPFRVFCNLALNCRTS